MERKVVITGASRGIGKVTADRFLDAGWTVIGTSRTVRQTRSIEWVQLDLARSGSIQTAAKRILATGPIDVLVNNAGILPHGERNFNAFPVNETALRETLEVNLIGTIDFTERLISNISRDGHIVLLGSMCGSLTEATVARSPMYSISKAALHMYGRQLASLASEIGITVSVIDPGWVKTDMGGTKAEREPREAAEEIYQLATTNVPTGKFWKGGKERDW